MLTGKQFELTKSTLALDVVGGRGWVNLPAGTTVKVIAGPNGEGDQLVDVLWQDHLLEMFAIELTARGVELKDQSTSA